LREAADKERGAKKLATRLREAADKERKKGGEQGEEQISP
jgi:hypothetical protein